jgi:hypothetical protein
VSQRMRYRDIIIFQVTCLIMPILRKLIDIEVEKLTQRVEKVLQWLSPPPQFDNFDKQQHENNHWIWDVVYMWWLTGFLSINLYFKYANSVTFPSVRHVVFGAPIVLSTVVFFFFVLSCWFLYFYFVTILSAPPAVW